MNSEELKEYRRRKSREAYAKDPEKAKARVRKYLEKNRDKHRERTRNWAQKNLTKVRRRKYWVKCAYGLTEQQLETMLLEQNGLCAICIESSDKTLCVDHDHKTGKIRGLLCQKCNQAIGLLADSVERFKRAIVYMEKSRG